VANTLYPVKKILLNVDYQKKKLLKEALFTDVSTFEHLLNRTHG